MISATTLAIISSYIMVLGNKKIAQPYSKVSYHPKFSLGSRFSFHSVSLQLSCSVVSDSATSWTAARQACLSITNSGACSDSCPSSWWCHPTIPSSVIPFYSCLQSFPASGSFPISQFLTSGVQSIGVSPLSSVLLINIQDRSPLGWTGWISLHTKGLSWVFSNTTDQSISQCSAFFIVQLSHPYMTTGKTIALTTQPFVRKVMSLLLNILSRVFITFLPRSKRILISWLQSPSAEILKPPKTKVWHCFHCFPIYFPWSDGTRWRDLRFLNVEL